MNKPTIGYAVRNGKTFWVAPTHDTARECLGAEGVHITRVRTVCEDELASVSMYDLVGEWGGKWWAVYKTTTLPPKETK